MSQCTFLHDGLDKRLQDGKRRTETNPVLMSLFTPHKQQNLSFSPEKMYYTPTLFFKHYVAKINGVAKKKAYEIHSGNQTTWTNIYLDFSVNSERVSLCESSRINALGKTMVRWYDGTMGGSSKQAAGRLRFFPLWKVTQALAETEPVDQLET